MKNSSRCFILSLAVLCAITSCKRVPGYVIDPDDMAELMADIHVGESVVEMNYSQFSDDSSRQALKQAILAKHGVTKEQLDTSFMWYGAHLDKYQDVYDRTIEILQKRLDESGAIAAAAASASISGDSVDIWSAPRIYSFSAKSPSRFMTFDVNRDNNWETGDSYTWRAKFVNNPNPAKCAILAEYSDGSVEVMNSQFSGDGWHEVTFYVDSTKTANRVYGFMEFAPNKQTFVYLDSVQLVRNRLNRERYQQRYRQRNYKFTEN